MSVDRSRAGASSGANSIPRAVRKERDGSTWNWLGSRPTAMPGSCRPGAAVAVIGVTSVLASVLVLAVVGHLTKSALG